MTPAPSEPLVTWNLILCVVAFPSLGYFVKKLIEDTQTQAINRYNMLHEEIKEIKDCVGGMKKDLNQKVDEADCLRMGREKWERINRHRHTNDGNVVIVP